MMRGTVVLALLGALAVAACGGGSSRPAASEPEAAQPDDDDDERPSERRSAVPDIGDEDDGLAVEGLRGRLDVYDIKRGMKPHNQALTDCYTSKLSRRNRFIGGDVEFQFVVNPDGSVKAVTLIKSDLGAWPMEKCMLQVCRQITFPAPKGGAEADFTVPLGFDASRPALWWDETRLESEIGDRTADLDACADEAGTSAPEDVWITLYVGSRGQVQSAGFASPDAPLPDAWADCAAAKATAWTLSDPRGRVAKSSFRYNPGQ